MEIVLKKNICEDILRDIQRQIKTVSAEIKRIQNIQTLQVEERPGKDIRKVKKTMSRNSQLNYSYYCSKI